MAYSCSCPSSVVLSNIPMLCERSRGGISKVLFAEYDPDAIVRNASGQVSSITSSVTWHTACIRKGTGSLSSELTVDAPNATNFYTNTLSLQFPRQNAVQRAKLSALGLAELMFVVTDANGVHHLLEGPASIASHSASTGTNATDGNNNAITFTSESNDLPDIISDELYETLTISED